MKPLITIITPVLNRASMIAEAVESVRQQTEVAVEHLVLDGGSTDGTLEVLAGYPGLEVTSEPDEGIYDALNKGIARARGEIIGFLNSDDRFVGTALAEAASRFRSDPTVDSVCGGARIVAGEAGAERVVATMNDSRMKSLAVDAVLGPPWLINARFFRAGVFGRIGTFDRRYRISADQDFLLRAAIARLRTVPLPGIVYEYRQHPGSLTISGNPKHRLRAAAECLDIACRYGWDPTVPPAEARQCRRWHAWLVGWGAFHALAGGDPRRAASLMRDGFSREPAWPLRVAPLVLAYARWRLGA